MPNGGWDYEFNPNFLPELTSSLLRAGMPARRLRER